jgi:hypothetical protein
MNKVDKFFDKLDEAWNDMVMFFQLVGSAALFVAFFGWLIWYGVTA